MIVKNSNIKENFAQSPYELLDREDPLIKGTVKHEGYDYIIKQEVQLTIKIYLTKLLNKFFVTTTQITVKELL